MRRSTRFLTLAIAMGICAPGAQAQFGGLKTKLKKKVEAAAGVGGGDSAARGGAGSGDATTSAPRRTGPRFDDRILEMTPEVLDRLAASLQAERTSRASAAAALAPAARQKWQACEQRVITSPE
ncbi:MAG TPA: hypothetical protein VFS44_14780, partial [Gemmatimonadaceae bacterium]|nr:hypothetical protein [Gemmatimonadaceae bacterium]